MGDLMSDEEYQQLMSYFENLSTEQLSVLLMEKDKDGILRNKINGLSIGPTFLEHTLCILQYYLRRLSSGYNVSQRNKYDRPNFQPLKFNSEELVLDIKNDPALWRLIKSAIQSFEKWAGTGLLWKDIIHHPPDLFMIEEELRLLNEACNNPIPNKRSSKTKQKKKATHKQIRKQQQVYNTRKRSLTVI